MSARFSKNVNLVLSSSIFDRKFYESASGTDFGDDRLAILHYLLIGWKLRLDPSPYFSSSYYHYCNGDMVGNPLIHYLLWGESEFRRPNPYFYPEIYSLNYPDVNSKIPGGLLAHYVHYGHIEGRQCSPSYTPSSINGVDKKQLYSRFLLNNKPLNYKVVNEELARLSLADDSPTFSILIPTYNTEVQYLEKAINSILNQSYQNFEICIADDASSCSNVIQCLSRFQQLDSRIKVIYRQNNGHISAASNSALELTVGDWLVLMDHDDELDEHALFFIAKEIVGNSEVLNFIYTDEDKIDSRGVRFDPHFKSDWNKDLFFSQNYISHLSVLRTNIVKEIGGFREGVEGSQDYDLYIRYLAYVNFSGVCHISKILYHWRAAEGSTALGASQKNYTHESGLRALKSYMENSEFPALVQGGMLPNTYKIGWLIPNDSPEVSIIIPTRDSLKIVKRAVDSIIEKTSYENYKIYIIDNQSCKRETQEWFDTISKNGNAEIIKYDFPFNYSAMNNYAVERASGELICLLNNDVEVINSDWLTELVSQALRPGVGCVGAKLYYPNNTIQHAGVVLGVGGVAGHSHKCFDRNDNGYFSRLKIIQNVSAVTAACLLVKKSVYNEVGGLNESELRVAFNDVDFCLKVMESGYRNVWTPYSELYHYESLTRGAEDTPDKVARFNREVEYMKGRWKQLLVSDPFYNQNLSLVSEDFSLALDESYRCFD